MVVASAFAVRAEDLSKYRMFVLGADLPRVVKLAGKKLTDVETIEGRPALIQILSWKPAKTGGIPGSVDRIVFIFYEGELYKISVTYDPNLTEGLTPEDVTKAVSEKYGPVTNVGRADEPTAEDAFGVRQNFVASWEDARFSVNLLHSSFSGRFGLILYSKQVSAEAEAGLAEAVRGPEEGEWGLEGRSIPQKKEGKDLEMTRQKNLKKFEP